MEQLVLDRAQSESQEETTRKEAETREKLCSLLDADGTAVIRGIMDKDTIQ